VTNPQTQTSDHSGRNAIISLLLPCLLIGHFLLNLLTPAHEFPMRTEQIMTMTFDALMFAGLFAFKRPMPQPLFWIALVAGLGLLALRLTSDAAWWTGHLLYSIPPR
jgi:hypothetical protein